MCSETAGLTPTAGARGRLRAYRGAVAVVTGGASGIGAALAGELVRRGAEVVVADRDAAAAEGVAEALGAAGGRSRAVALDVRDAEAFAGVVRAAAGRGRLDYLFNNAGIAIGGEARLHRREHWQRVLDVNLGGVVNGVQAAYPVMRGQGFGHIVNTASMAGLIPSPGGVSYAASKHAVVGLSTSLRLEARAHGVRVTALCPGAVRTPILHGGRHGGMLQTVPAASLERLWQRLRPLPPDRLASRVLDALPRDPAVLIVPGWWRAIWWLNRLSPALGRALALSWYRAALREVAGDEPPAAESGSRSAD